MFATGLPQLSMGFFGAASMTVSIPSAVTIFAWLGTMWYGRVVLATPMLFAIAFIMQFVIGGISGVMTAAVPFDWQVTDTYFVVAHLHYVLAGGTLFGVLAGIYYWAPKMFGVMMSETLGKVSFWLTFVGFNVGFFPMHIVGLAGMSRRIYTYDASTGFGAMNMLETIGVYVFALGLIVTLWNFVQSKASGEPAPNNPWGAASLEWLAASPPEHYNFAHIPVIHSREPLWDGGYSPGPSYHEARLTPRTSTLDATLEEPVEMPHDNVWAIVMPLTLLLAFAALLLHSYTWSAIGTAASLLCMARWMWPSSEKVLETVV
jgi:cytochrome c oxidase subunit 1/cytochrome c oxidase subunit I+III